MSKQVSKAFKTLPDFQRAFLSAWVFLPRLLHGNLRQNKDLLLFWTLRKQLEFPFQLSTRKIQLVLKSYGSLTEGCWARWMTNKQKRLPKIHAGVAARAYREMWTALPFSPLRILLSQHLWKSKWIIRVN